MADLETQNLPPGWDDFWKKKEAAGIPVTSSTEPSSSQSPLIALPASTPSAPLPPGWDSFWANKTGAKPGEGTAPLTTVEDFDYQLGRQEHQARKKANEAVEVERTLPEEVGASLVRGGLGLAKLPLQVAKIAGADVLGSKTVERATVPLIESLEETAESPEWKPGKQAGGAPIDLDRIISNPGEVVGQITSQATNPQFWAAQLPEGAMSMIPAIVGGWAPRAVAMAGKLGTAMEAAKIAGDTAKIAEIGAKLNRLSTIGVYGMSMAMEAAQGEEKIRDYEERNPDKPIPWANRVLSILGTGVVAGGLEALSFGRVFMGKYGGEVSLPEMIKQVMVGKEGGLIVRKILDSVVTEGVTEGAQSLVENAFAKWGYDPDQKLTEGIVESILIGAALGGIGGTIPGLTTRHKAVKEVAARIQETKRQAEEEYQGTMQAAQEGAARGEVYAGMQGPQEITPEPVLAPTLERQGPQPVTSTPKEQQQAIFGGELGRIIEGQENRVDAVRALVPRVGDFDRAERFYDLYEQGDAATALQEFPEFSAWATPAQQEVSRGLPRAFGGKRRAVVTTAPMGVTGGEVAETARATTIPAPGAAEITPGPPPLSGTTAPGPTISPVAPMGVTGIEAAAIATKPKPAVVPPTLTLAPPEIVPPAPSGEVVSETPLPNPPDQSVNTPQEASNAFVEGNLPPAAPEIAPQATEALPEGQYPPSWTQTKDEFLNSWEDEVDAGVIYRDEDGTPEATWSADNLGRVVLQKGEEGLPIKNPETGDIYFDTPEDAKEEYHRQEVLTAHRAGQQIPAEVLGEYPETKQGDLFSAQEPQGKPVKPLPAAFTGKKTKKTTTPTWLERLADLHPDSTLQGEKLSAQELALREKAMNVGLIGVDITSKPPQWRRLGDLRKWLVEQEAWLDSGTPPASTFKTGDRVSWTERGKELTGTIETGPDKDGEVDIKVDQVAAIGGRVPIGRVSVGVKVENLTKLVEPLAKKEEAPIIETKEAKAGKGEAYAVANRPAGTGTNGEASPKGQRPRSIPGTRQQGSPGTVRSGTGAANSGSGEITSLSSDSEGSEPSSGGRERPATDSSGGKRSPASSGRVRPKRVSGVPDYSAGPGDLKREGGWKGAAARNLDIIELIKKLTAEGRQATPDEQALLAKYVGWGASEIANNLFNTYSHGRRQLDPGRARQGWEGLVQRAQDLFTPEELETAVASTRNAHYTSESVVRSIFDGLERLGFKGGLILEPGMGIGNFPILMPGTMKDASSYTGLELDHTTAAIAKQLLPNQNIIQGDFVKQAFPDNFFDVGLGNPPFADTKILGDPIYAKYRFALHDYFFAKTLDKIRPGGLMVFITSRYTMDKGKDLARKYLAERADLIGAIRLPQTAFKDNAGTEVVTDVLFFRKRAPEEEPGGEPWLGHAELELPYTEKVWHMTVQGYQQVEETKTKKVLVNEYFAAHPEMILGKHTLGGTMYHANEYTVEIPKDWNIEQEFARAVGHLPQNVYSIVAKSADDQKNVVYERDFNPKVKKEGQVYVDDSGKVMIVDKGSGLSIDAVTGRWGTVTKEGKKVKDWIPKKLTSVEKEWIKDYVGLRDALKTAQYDQREDLNWESSFKELEQVYDAFVKKHGPVLSYTLREHEKETEDGEIIVTSVKDYKYEDLLFYDVESPLVYALEKINKDTGEITKDRVLLERTIQKPVRKKPDTAAEALIASLDEFGQMDLDHIAKILDMPVERIIEDLGDLIYEDPVADWQTIDEYLSGNVVQKLEEAEAIAETDSRFARNVEALRTVQPIPLTPAEVELSLGVSWVPPELVSQFAQEVLEMQKTNSGSLIQYEPTTHLWQVAGATGKGSHGARTISDWSTDDRSAAEILDAVLNNKNITIKRTEHWQDEEGHDKERKVTDVKATTRVHDIMEKMENQFRTWFWQDSNRSAEMLDIYNRRFNNLAGREFNGDHLTLPGFTALIKLRKHQKRAIWRGIQTGNMYLAHAVGSGKTFVMIATAMEEKRLGLIQKPMFVVPNHMLGQFAKEFMEAYPMANIMVADEKNFHKNNRRRFMAQSALNKPDAIIVTHSAFGLIGMKPESVEDLRLKFVQDFEDLIDALEAEENGAKVNKRQIKQVQKRIDQMNQRFAKMTAGRKDQALTFEEMGVDKVVVDEAHEFRKLDFTTNQDRVKGIDSNGSMKALDLYSKVNWLEKQNPGRSHVFASGTPVTNTLGELYTVMRFFDKGDLVRDGIHYFDAWAAMFGRAVEDYEMNAAGNVEPVTRFSRFVNLPELGSRVRQFMDVLTSRQLSGYVDLPTIAGGAPEIVLAPKSPEYKNYQDHVLKPRIDVSRKWKPSHEEPGNPDPLLAIITDGRLGAIDMRFHGSSGSMIPSKLQLMADEVVKQYHDTKDLVYWTEDENGVKHTDPIKGATQIVFYNLGFGANVRANRGFDSRKAFMDRLKVGGVPAREVAWIDDYTSAEAKENLYRKLRSGEMKVLIGSAPKMSTGLNIQKRLAREHYLDPPWYPALVQQADGRMIRQGNQNTTVRSFRYATKGSYDATQWGMVARKAEGIEKFLEGDRNIRSLDDISEVSHYQMAAAQASGDQRHVELAKLKAAVQKYKQLYGQWQQDQRTMAGDIRNLKNSSWSGIPGYAKTLKEYKEARLQAPHIWPENLKGTVAGQSGTFTQDTKNAFGVALVRAYNTRIQELFKKGKEGIFEEVIGTLNGHNIILEVDASLKALWDETGKKKVGERLEIMAHMELSITKPITLQGFARGSQFEGDPTGLITRMVNSVNNLRREEEQAQAKLDEAKAELKRLERQIDRPFEYERDFKEAEARVAEIQSELVAEGVIANAAQGHAVPEIFSDEMAGAITDGLEMERTATQRTGPTIATAMRRPLPAGIVPKKAAAKYKVQPQQASLAARAGLGAKKTTTPNQRVTKEQVQAAFPGAKVTESQALKGLYDGFQVDLPNGKRIIVRRDEFIMVNPQNLLEGYGQKALAPGERIVGEAKRIEKGAMITLAKGVGVEILDHETFHVAMDMVLTEREKKAVLKQHGDEEAAALAYETWEPAKTPDTLFQKVLDFFRRAYRSLFPDAASVFGKVKFGEVWGRKAKETQATAKYAVRPAAAEARAQAYQDKMVASEGKGKPGWQNLKDTVFLRGDTKQEATDTLRGWYDELVDRYAPFERAETRALKAGGLLPKGESPTYTLAYWRGQEGWTAQAVMKNGVYHETKSGDTFTGDNRKVGESLTQRLDPIRELAKKRGEKPEAVMNDLFNRFMIAQRDLELAGETGARKAGEIKGVNPDESRAVLEVLQEIYGADYKVLEQVAGRLEASGDFSPGSIREWADQAILQRLEQAGIITPELRQEIKSKNQLYLPFRRLMDEVDNYVEAYARALGVKGKVIATIKGSEKQILDPLQMLMDLAAKANYAYARNRVLDSLAKLGQFDPEIREVKTKVVPGIPKPATTPFFGLPTQTKTAAFSPLPPEEGTVPYYREGKMRWLKLPPDMFKATQSMMPQDLGLLLTWAKKPADLLRAGAVTTPEFGLITNPLRDITQAWVFSRFGFSPLKWVRDLGLLLSKDAATLELRHQAEAGGGFMATLAQSMLAPEKITADDITGKRQNMWFAAHPVQALRHVSAYLENMTRFSIYKQAREKGLSHAEAIHEMRRTTLDFRRTGGHPVVRYLNMIVPFFNASIQGTDKLLSELAGPNKHKVLRRLALLMAGSIGLWLLAHQDDRYKELENWERNYFWHIPLGKDGPMIRLPKPFEAGILFGSVPERILDQLVDKNVGGVKSALGAAWKALTPEFIPAFARPLIEGAANYNWFLDRPIEDLSLKALPVELRSKPWTTELAKAVSKYVGPAVSPVMELSPVKVEHLIRTTSGGLGANFFLPGIDVALRKAGVLEDLPQPAQDAIQKIWGVRALFTKPPVGYRAKSVNDFFERYQTVLQADQGWKNLWNAGSMDQLDKFLADSPEAMFARVARKQMDVLGKIKKERNAIYQSKILTPEQKRNKLNALDEKIVTLARAGNALMDPEVAQAVKMPSRFQRDAFGGRKSMDLDGYYKFTVESVGDAYDAIQKGLPRLLRLDEAQRQRHLIKAIRQAREEYQPVLKKLEDVTKPYRFSNLLDKPSRAERARWQQMMGVKKAGAGEITGYRLKEEEARMAP